MNNLRTYGTAPFRVAVIHGGPGAWGEMAPVAKEIAFERGVLEPLQTATSLQGQVRELTTVLEKHADLPVTLIGFSWGAWLSFIVAATYTIMVKKLILVGSGPFQQKYADTMQEIRSSRLGAEERAEYESIIRMLEDPASEGKAVALARLGVLAAKTDAYDPILSALDKSESVGVAANFFHGVLEEAVRMRNSGSLLELAPNISCPVVAIHGDYDPHPAEGVQEPLSGVLQRFRLILLKDCGHKPWIERQAMGHFYERLRSELGGCDGPGLVF